jgi:hypothetical protein
MADPELRTACCHRCGCLFWLCLDCDRDQCFCNACRLDEERRKRHRAANSKYQQTRQGRRLHSARQCKYRARLRDRDRDQDGNDDANKVTDRASQPVNSPPTSETQAEEEVAPPPFVRSRTGSESQTGSPVPRCAVCGRTGRVVDAFSRSVEWGVERDAGGVSPT